MEADKIDLNSELQVIINNRLVWPHYLFRTSFVKSNRQDLAN